jgi:hypothetical protein
VRLRIEGERVGLPAPVFTPYLVGLLVMLGLLGTFVGMVETLQGAVLALEGSTDLAAIRSGLAAPIEGLGLAFGTSVAGVASSAMLGLNSTLCRRERMLATRELDSAINTVFRKHSLNYNRQQTFAAMQQQAQALPQVAEQLTGLTEKLQEMSVRLEQTLVANQATFQEGAEAHYSKLAASVGQALQDSLADSGRLAGEAISPVVAGAMEQINEQHQVTRRQLAAAVEQQLACIGGRIEDAASTLAGSFKAANSGLLDNLAATAGRIGADAESRSRESIESIGSLLQSSEALVQARIDTERAWSESQGERMAQLNGTLAATLENLRQAEEQRGAASNARLAELINGLETSLGKLHALEEQRSDAAVARLGKLEEAAANHLTQLGRELEGPMSRLLESAAETPRAAAEVIGKLREEVSNNIERDNDLLEERRQLMQQLGGLAASLEQTSGDQQQAVVELVASSQQLLREMGESLGDRVESEVARVGDIAAEVSGSAHEVAALGEAFSASVTLFGGANDRLIDSLQNIEQALDKSSSRSDEQMGYYVAQAREIIDQSMLSQREIIDELRRLGSTEELSPAEAG